MRTDPQVPRRIAAWCGLMLASLASAGLLTAQVPDAHWQPWLGCWSASNGQTVRSWTGATTDGLVCIVPANSGQGVEVTVVANGTVVHREAIAATGQRVAKTVERCPGWESGTWSADNRRLFLRSEFTCGQTVVKGSSVFAISSEGDWIEVRGTTVGGNATARAIHYRPSGYTITKVAGAVMDSVTLALAPTQAFAARYARQGAGEAVRTDAVLEVAKAVDGQVAEAWLNELGQGFVLNARELVRLADAGMPPSMIDLMVALSYPTRFAVQRRAPDQTGRNAWEGASGGGGYFGGSRLRGDEWNCRAGYLPTTYSAYSGDPCMSGYYGYGQGYGYGYGRYDYGLYNGQYSGYYYGPLPLVIVPSTPGTTSQVEGQAVKGAGYTRRTGGQSAAPASTPRASSGDASGSSGGQSTAPASSSTGSGSGDAGRTAKPRVPPG